MPDVRSTTTLAKARTALRDADDALLLASTHTINSAWKFSREYSAAVEAIKEAGKLLNLTVTEQMDDDGEEAA